ncbi:MAG TPA: DUF4340 domain-containing protein [Fodinibius sp.]|nr:DUF4340 domain-containing protein [Fodinibius sp.]
MTNATKTLAVIFVVISLLTAAVKWSSGPEASEAFRSELISADTSQVSRMVIEQPAQGPLTLEKSERKWRVSSASSESYPADSQDVNQALTRLLNLNITAVATRNPENFTRYRVDSTGIRVSLFDGENLLSKIFVGAPQSAGQRSLNNYVRLDNEDAVYAVEGYLQSTFTKGLDDWRNKTVWDIDQSGISQVSFSYPADSSFVIEKVPEADQTWVSGSDTLSYPSVRPILRELSSLEASGFVDSLAKDTFGAEKYTLRVTLAGGEQHQLRLIESETDTTVYLASNPDFPYVFSMEKNTWDEQVLKSRSELLND